MKKNIVFIAVIVIALLGIGFFLKSPDFSLEKIDVLGEENQKSKIKDITIEEAKSKANDFIAKNMVQPGTEFSITDVSEENGLYKLQLDVSGQEVAAYISKDGKTFFPSALDIAETEKQTAEAQQQPPEEEKEIPKADKPQVDLYVMSFCPYGNKAEDTLKPAYNLLKDKVDFNFHYIVSSSGDKIQSLHGEPEVIQNEREACVLRDYGKDSWIDFATYVNTSCGTDGSCWEDGAESLGLNVSKIETCVSSDGTALMKADEEASTEAGASGSPTMMINGVETKAVYQYGNSEAYKQAICSAFNETPSECAETLEATATTAGGSCN
ncbi:MAG: hypothetical protein PF549_00890 [Patescibacteria group bacterium]|jgi:glutaredoxin|nr:hypothetical protein [Patescibacteria group bacterium]